VALRGDFSAQNEAGVRRGAKPPEVHTQIDSDADRNSAIARITTAIEAAAGAANYFFAF
jgi:hypothetical protein